MEGDYPRKGYSRMTPALLIAGEIWSSLNMSLPG